LIIDECGGNNPLERHTKTKLIIGLFDLSKLAINKNEP